MAEDVRLRRFRQTPSEAILDGIAEQLRNAGGLNIPEYDTVELSYTGADLTGVSYQLGGEEVAAVTLAYADGQLSSITKS